jgi:hypothetical protein
MPLLSNRVQREAGNFPANLLNMPFFVPRAYESQKKTQSPNAAIHLPQKNLACPRTFSACG